MYCRDRAVLFVDRRFALDRKWEDVDHDAEDGISHPVSSPTAGGAFDAEVKDPLGLGAPVE